MTALTLAARRTFRSLHVRNYRVYFIVQLISISGTWMDAMAQSWLVLHLGGSGVDLGIVVGLQALPMLLFGPWGGLVADRMDKRKLLFLTQLGGAAIAVLLGTLVLTGTAVLWQVDVLAFALGMVTLFDSPARQAFVLDLVGREDLPNAVSLNTVIMNASRVVGPAIAGVVITFLGLTLCFYVNAVSFVAVIIGLSLMRPSELYRTPPVERSKGQLRDGFRYVWHTPKLRDTLLALAVIGIFAYNFRVTLALLAQGTFHGGAGAYSLLTACLGGGAVVGGLVAAHHGRPSPRRLQILVLVFAVLLIVVSLAPTLPLAAGATVLMGAASIAFVATANASLQLEADPAMRGRVMALFTMAFMGSNPIGAPLVGAVSEWTNPRVATIMGGVAAALSGGILFFSYRRSKRLARTRLAEGPAAVPLAAEAEDRAAAEAELDAVARAAEVEAMDEAASNVA